MKILMCLLATMLTSLSGEGWQIQHESLSYDKQTIFFSAIKPGEKQHDIYFCTREKNVWSAPVLLPSDVNDTQWDDIWPSISPDEQELYFVRRTIDETGKKPVWRQDIYLSQRNGIGGWTKAQPLVFSDGGSLSPMMLEDGQTLLFSSCHQVADSKRPHYGIYFTRKSGKNNWLLPEVVALSDNAEVNLLAPRVVRTPDGTYHVHLTQQIVSRKDTTYQQSSTMLPAHMSPRPMMSLSGTVIDSKTGKRLQADLIVSDAISQTVRARYKTSKTGEFSIALAEGDNYSIDITKEGYSHQYLDYDCRALTLDTVVKESVSLTPELSVTLYIFDAETNSSLGEENKVLSINKEYDIEVARRGYETTLLHLDTRKAVLLPSSELDIMLIPGKAALTIRLHDSESGEVLYGQVALSNQQRKQELTYLDYALNLRQGDSYHLSANVVGYLYYDTLLTVPLSQDPMLVDIAMTPIKQSMVLQLRNIQFETASYDLQEESYIELDKVVRLLKDNPLLKIELSAHTDDQGTDVFNKRLSERRGEAARNYIIRHGIDAERISAKGYGKTQPLVPNISDENRAINRRVEIKVIEL